MHSISTPAEFSPFASMPSPSIQQNLVVVEPIIAGKSSSSLKTQGSFYLDPTLVTEVEDDYHDDEEPSSPVIGNEAGSSSQYNDYTLTKDGYKSFHGGWVEGITETNDIYYYNVHTGQSSWNLPDLVEKEKTSSSGEFSRDQNNEPHTNGATDNQGYWDEHQPTSYDYQELPTYYDSAAYDQTDYQIVPVSDSSLQPYDNYDSQWTMSEALGIGNFRILTQFTVLDICVYFCRPYC